MKRRADGIQAERKESAREGQSQAASATAERRHNQMIEALSGGKAAGQGGEGEGERGDGAPLVE
jgi:hypothetical protein